MLEYGGRLRRYSGTIPRINPLVLIDVERAQRKLNRLARTVPTEAPWEAADAERLDSQTAATWLRRNVATRAGRSLLQLGIEAVWAAEPEDMSLLHMLFYIHSAGSLQMLFDTEGGAQQDRFVGGSQLLAHPHGGGARRASGCCWADPCRAIGHGPDGVVVRADGAEVRARRAIVAIAPTLAGRISYDPPLSGFRDQLTQRMPLGTVAKCMAVYDEPFWRADGLSGEATSASRARCTVDVPGSWCRRRYSSVRGLPSSTASAWSSSRWAVAAFSQTRLKCACSDRITRVTASSSSAGVASPPAGVSSQRK